MFRKGDDQGFHPVIEKIRMRTQVHGADTLLVEVHLEQGAVLPNHHHPHEQTGYLVSGRLDLTFGGETYQARPGDSWNIPGGTGHSATALEDSVAIEVFAPVREDYLRFV
jgi:quercetin dioxygenase-like cupin family protein